MEIRSAISASAYSPHRAAASVPSEQAVAPAAGVGEGDEAAAEIRAEDTKAVRPASTAEQAEQELTQEQQRDVELLKKRDTEVRTHEQAHLAAAGRYATSAPSYDYQTGPDGKRYAVGGEVGIDTSSLKDPSANLEKARTLIRAALAPANPSGQDYRVAASARAMESQALRDLSDARQQQSDSDADAAVAGAVSGIAARSGKPPDAQAGADAGQAASGRSSLDRRIDALFAPAAAGFSRYA